MRRSCLPLGCMLTAAVVVGCKRPESRASAPPIESTTADAIASEQPTIEIREGKPINLGTRLVPNDLAEDGDGGVMVLDRSGLDHLTVRRVAADLRTAWELPVLVEDRRYGQIIHSAVIVAGTSVWVALTFNHAIAFADQRAVSVAVDKYDFSPDLLLLRLDLGSGKVLAAKQYGEHALVQRVLLATDGSAVYAALMYRRPSDGKPGWGPPGTPPGDVYRFVRFENDGSTRWIVDATANGSSGPEGIRATSCCVLVRGHSSVAFHIGAVPVTPDDARHPPAWAAVLGAQDGQILDARFLNVATPPGHVQEGYDGVATLDGEGFHFAFEAWPPNGTTGVIAFWQPASKAHRRMVLECGSRVCAPLALEVIGEHVLAVLSGGTNIEARLYTKTGDIVAESHFLPHSQGNTIHVGRRDDGVILYLATWDTEAPTPVEVRVRTPAEN